MYQKLFALVLVYYVAEMSMSPYLPSQREDVMGTYFLLNRYQCERLCWYRKLCKTYSYIYNRTLATGGNCVLHAENIAIDTTSGVSTDWVEREAFWDEALQDNGCRSRTCNDTQVCVPTFASPFYACLPLPAECQAPHRYDGVYSNVTLLQGQRTNFTCNSSLVWVPRHDKTVTCQVTGKYSELKGTCVNATYYSPSVPFNKPFPDAVSKDWEACFKGNFTQNGTNPQRMTFNFHDSQNGSHDNGGGGKIHLCIDFRYAFTPVKSVHLYKALNQQWDSITQITPFPLQPNSFFEITLKILFNNTMLLIYKDYPTQQVDLVSNNINLTNATYLEILRDVELSYVNLGRGCD